MESGTMASIVPDEIRICASARIGGAEHAPVVRFADVTPERISTIVARVEDDDERPLGWIRLDLSDLCEVKVQRRFT
jgi:hypothetical protein